MAEEARTTYMNPLAARGCVGCFETSPDLRQLQCGCLWCRDCLERYLQMKLAEKYRWPPRCCSLTLRDQDVEWIQSSVILEEYRKIDREKRETPPLYCSQEQCRATLNTQNIIEGSSTVVCDKCKSKTCQKCERDHEPNDPGCEGRPIYAELEALVQHEGWQKCSRCNNTVSRASGCSHIICYCGHEFCYRCGLTWKSCDCEDALDYIFEETQQQGGELPVMDWEQEIRRRMYQARESQTMRRNNKEKALEEVEELQRSKKENQRPGQRHGHGSPTLSEESYRRTGAAPGQSQYLPYRQPPEPLIENPLRYVSPNRIFPSIPESSSSTLPPQNEDVDSLLNYLPYLQVSEMDSDINIRRPRWRQRHRRQRSRSLEVHDPPLPDLSTTQQKTEEIATELPIRQSLGLTIGLGFFAPARRALPQIHDPLPTEQNTPTEPEIQPEPAPQDEVPHASSPYTPPSQLSPPMPSSPPPWFPRSH